MVAFANVGDEAGGDERVWGRSHPSIEPTEDRKWDPETFYSRDSMLHALLNIITNFFPKVEFYN